MTDYGHDLIFGTFSTPAAQQHDAVIALAQHAEQVGLDMVTIQDHPYNPGFLDAYTLLTWIAASTSKLRVSANVTNLPLRFAPVLAKMAASIDILSGGRFEMGLGAGGFAEAIKSMGGPSLTPGESIEAASEAMDLMRGIWRGDGQMFKLHGKHYDVPGVRSGPQPAHDIGIWLGAYKPRILRLTGTKADGWLPSLGYLKLEDVAESHRIIDEAALTAGRDPREIRRLLNISSLALSDTNEGFLKGPREQLINQLQELIFEYGFSGFFISGDDPTIMEVVGKDIAPAVREAVSKARTVSGTVPAPSAADRQRQAARLPDINYEAIPDDLKASAVEPGDRDYDNVRHSYIYAGSPGLVLMPRSANEVSEAVLYARAQNKPIAVRSGGHGIAGHSTNDGGIVIDLRHLNRIEVLDRTKNLVRIEAGARWGQVAEELEKSKLALSSGDYGGVGVGGLATTGGLGYFARKYGLTIDRIRAAEIVLVDGNIVRADADTNPDLFWAIRGAGANFGVVTSFEFEAYEIGNVIRAIQVFDLSDAETFLVNWGRIIEAAPRELTSFLSVFSSRKAPMAQAISVFAGDDTEAATKALTPLLDAGPVLQQQAHIAPYPTLVPWQEGPHGGSTMGVSHSGLIEHITPEIAGHIASIVRSRSAEMVQLRAAGGAVNDMPADATAYAHRTQNFSLLAASYDNPAALNAQWDQLKPLLKGMYAAFETDMSPEILLAAYPEPTLSRLRQLKAKYDPDNVFNTSFNILPAADNVVA